MTVSREYRIFTRTASEQLVSAYKWSRDHGNTPEETADILTDAIGKDSAAEIIAACILRIGDWDQRISPANREWAVRSCERTSKELDQIAGFYYPYEIHPAHMDQIADVFRTRQ